MGDSETVILYVATFISIVL